MERELFDLDILVGNWESINLNSTVMIHRNGENHQLSIIYMNETTNRQVLLLTRCKWINMAILYTLIVKEFRLPIAKD